MQGQLRRSLRFMAHCHSMCSNAWPHTFPSCCLIPLPAEAEQAAAEAADAEVEDLPAVAAEESMPAASGAPTAENSCESLGKQSSDMDQENINQGKQEFGARFLLKS